MSPRDVCPIRHRGAYDLSSVTTPLPPWILHMTTSHWRGGWWKEPGSPKMLRRRSPAWVGGVNSNFISLRLKSGSERAYGGFH